MGFAGRTRFGIQDNFIWIFGVSLADNIYFATIAQRHDANTVILYVLCVHMTNEVPYSLLNNRFNAGETYRLTLRIDGDYMDVGCDYYRGNCRDRLVGTFCDKTKRS